MQERDRLAFAGRYIIACIIMISIMAPGEAYPAAAVSGPQPFEPDCGSDQACRVWAAFRKERPFPKQSFAAAKTSDGALALILSEPPVGLTKSGLKQLAQAAFGADLLEYADRRWMIGADGWIEDAVLKIKWPPEQAALPDPAQDTLLRDRLDVLHLAMYGTAFGGVLEKADEPFGKIARGTAPDIAPTPGELHEWLNASASLWTPVDAGEGAQGVRLSEVMNRGPAGVYLDGESQLVVFVLPHEALDQARKGEAGMDRLRVPFRKFAVANDAILGGAWNDKGSIVLAGRARRRPLAAIAPLRFETFAALLGEAKSELHQSYERNNLFADKLVRGPYEKRDWAPILLSKSLIDTEFGALLNITDQILKSWSEAGEVEYLYFNYPLRPAAGAFVFGAKPLSKIVFEETKGTSVLFNWNTSGAAVTLRYPNMSVLAAGRTSALPVTYGSEVAGEEMKTGDKLPELRRRENSAYDYFARQCDPNLARVVSYTVMYQVFQAAHKDAPQSRQADPAGQIGEAEAFMAQEAEAFLAQVELGTLKPLDFRVRWAQRNDVSFAQEAVRSYYQRHGRDPAALARILTGQNRMETMSPRMRQRVDAFYDRQAALSRRINAFNKRIEQHNKAARGAAGDLRQAGELQQNMASLDKERRTIETEQAALTADTARIKAELAQDAEQKTQQSNDAGRVRNAISALKPAIDLERVRAAYVKAHDGEPDGRIKTPSIVVSWSTQVMGGVGGHNLNSRTLEIRIDPKANAMKFETGRDGLKVLVAPPSAAATVAARAREIARKIEHENAGIGEVTRLTGAGTVAPVRARQAALGSGSFDALSLGCGLGCKDPAQPAAPRPASVPKAAAPRAPSVKEAAAPRAGSVQEALASALAFDKSYDAAIARDAGAYLVATREGQSVKCCKSFLSVARLQEALKEAVPKGRSVVVVGESEAYTKALVESAVTGDLLPVAALLGSGARKAQPEPAKQDFAAASSGYDFFILDAPQKPADGLPSKDGRARSGFWSRLSIESGERKQAYAAANKAREFPAAAFKGVEGPAAAALAEKLGAKQEGDSEFYVNQITFKDRSDAHFVAALAPGRASEGKAAIEEALAKVRAQHSRASLAEFFARVKAHVAAKKDCGVVRMQMVMSSGSLRLRVASRDAAPPGAFVGFPTRRMSYAHPYRSATI